MSERKPVGWKHEPEVPLPSDAGRVEDAVRELDPEDHEALQRVIQYEEKLEDQGPRESRDEPVNFDLGYGWEPSKVHLAPGQVRKLTHRNLVVKGYNSNNHTHYYLVNRDAVKRAIEEMPDDEDDGATAGDKLMHDPGSVNVEIQNPVMDEDLFDQVKNADDDTLTALANLLAPEVHGLMRAKKALLLSLASQDDRNGDRARIHTLLYGPEGTAKTPLVEAAARIAEAPLFSPRNTEAGLTVDLRTGEPGVMPKMHATEFGLFALDELDDADRKPLQHMLGAMSDGRFTATGASLVETYPAMVRVVAAANRTDAFSSEFLDRIDYTIEVRQPTKDEAKDIVSTVTRSWMRPGHEDQERFLRNYIRSARRYEPAFSDTVRGIAEERLHVLIDLADDTEVKVRPKVSILRTAYTLAKLDHEPVGTHHVNEAVKLMQPRLWDDYLNAIRQ